MKQYQNDNQCDQYPHSPPRCPLTGQEVLTDPALSSGAGLDDLHKSLPTSTTR